MKAIWTWFAAFFKKSDRVLRHELSPDDWMLIWPELTEQSTPIEPTKEAA